MWGTEGIFHISVAFDVFRYHLGHNSSYPVQRILNNVSAVPYGMLYKCKILSYLD